MHKKIIYSVIAAVLLILGKFLLHGDYLPFLQWWITVAYLGIVFLPLTSVIFTNFHDKGYLFSKAVGIAGAGYLMWLLSSLHVMKFTVLSCIITAVICLALNCVLLYYSGKSKKPGSLMDETSTQKNELFDHILAEELLFFATFLLFTYIRGFNPDAYGTEKFMDYGFMTSMMRSDYMPPQDFWFSGSKLNYYYVGQYIATFLTKLSAVKVTVGYNLALMMVGAFAFVFPYSLVYNVTRQLLIKKQKKNRIIPALSGLIGGTGVCLAGNMHYPAYIWFEPAVRKFFGMEKSTYKYWFPDATRFIGYHPETHDKTIHEFPCYSFVLGDLHAHVINIMFVVTVLGILFAWMCSRKARQNEKITVFKEVFDPAIILVSFFIGLFHTTNFWDFPIYFVVSGAVILFTNLIVYNFKRKALAITALQGIIVIILSELVCMPFTLSFDQISTSLCLAVAHTPLNQLVILWGLPIFMVIAFLLFTVGDYHRRSGEKQVSNNKKALASYMASLSESDLFIITIGLCAIGLVFLPEVIYVRDIYSGDYKRANTMFKLTYQAFIMFGICFGYVFTRLLAFGETKRQRKVAVVGLLLFSLSVCYVQNAVKSWYGNIFHTSGYKGINCTSFLETKPVYKDDIGVINWLNKNVTGMPVILEVNGDSYSDNERISVMTGLPTVLGWRTHEWLWKGDTALLDARSADIEKIYTSTDQAIVKNLLKKYNISYIIVGKLEQDKFSLINHPLIKSLGEVVYISHATSDKSYETYIVKIQN